MLRLSAIIFFSATLLSITNGQTYDLTLSSTSQTIVLGESIEMELSIRGIEPEQIISPKGFEVKTNSNRFVYAFQVIPDSTGELTLGPYHIKYDGKELTSNTITVLVRDKVTEENMIRVKLPPTAKVGEMIIFEISNGKTSMAEVVLKERDELETKASSTSSSLRIVNGERKNTYAKSFNIIFHKPGIYSIDESWFRNIPDYFTIDGNKIKVQ